MIRFIILALAILGWQQGTFAQLSSPVAIVRNVLSLPDDRLDYGRAKLGAVPLTA